MTKQVMTKKYVRYHVPVMRIISHGRRICQETRKTVFYRHDPKSAVAIFTVLCYDGTETHLPYFRTHTLNTHKYMLTNICSRAELHMPHLLNVHMPQYAARAEIHTARHIHIALHMYIHIALHMYILQYIAVFMNTKGAFSPWRTEPAAGNILNFTAFFLIWL